MTIRSSLIALTVIFGLFAGVAQAAKPTPVGYWITINEDTKLETSVIHIYEKGGKLYGKIVKILDPKAKPNALCDKCEGKFKDKPILGMEILWGMVQDDDEWEDGRILDPNNGEDYGCEMSLESADRLKVRGFLGFSLLGRTQIWHRTTKPTPAEAAKKADG